MGVLCVCLMMEPKQHYLDKFHRPHLTTTNPPTCRPLTAPSSPQGPAGFDVRRGRTFECQPPPSPLLLMSDGGKDFELYRNLTFSCAKCMEPPPPHSPFPLTPAHSHLLSGLNWGWGERLTSWITPLTNCPAPPLPAGESLLDD
ncbi:unnamed protein product [Lota lota]